MTIRGIGKYKRIWIGELPEATYPPDRTSTISLPAKTVWSGTPLLAAVELVVPRGPRIWYGLLGGRLEPRSSDKLTITLTISGHSGPVLTDTLAPSYDEVRVGLPGEYVEAVVAGFKSAAAATDALVAGELTVNCAAHGLVGSSNAIFEHLGDILLKLFNNVEPEITDERLTTFLPERFA